MNRVSLVIPFYNESFRLQKLEDYMHGYLQKAHQLGEIIFIDDGSTDDTLLKLQALSRKLPLPCHVLQVKPNRGKGYCVSRGVQASCQAWILCLDADLSYLPAQLDEWIAHGLDLTDTRQAWFGSRELGIKLGLVKYQLHRRIIGRIYALLIRLVVGVKNPDTQCGFKLYPRWLALELFNQVGEQRFAFDVEVHYLLQKWGIPPGVLPVGCNDHGNSRVRLIRDSLQMAMALFAIRKRHWHTGKLKHMIPESQVQMKRSSREEKKYQPQT